MPSKQACLQHAAELVRIAQDCDDPAKKIRLISMANAWLKFAERVEARAAARQGGRDGASESGNRGGDTKE